MKEFKIAKRSTRTIGSIDISYNKFIYDGIRGLCAKITSPTINATYVIYDGCECMWGTNKGKEEFSGQRFKLPKYEDFVRQIKTSFDIEVPTTAVSKNTNIFMDKIKAALSKATDTNDIIEIPVETHKQEDKISNISKITILDKTEDRYSYKEYECIDAVTKFMYNGKEGKYTKNVFGSIVTHTIECNGFKTVVKSNRNEPEGDRYELPEHSDFVNQIRDAFGVELPIIKREHNKIAILKKTETKERSVNVTTYTFEFNGKPGTCTHRNGENINATRIEYDGKDKEWGYYSGDWDCTSYTFTDPKYDEFKKSAKEVLHAYDFPNR